MSVNAKDILSPFENIANCSADFGAKVMPIKEVFKSLKKSEIKILKNGKTEVFKALKYILKSDIKVMKAQADSVSMELNVEGNAVKINHEKYSKLSEMNIKLGVFSSTALGENSEESRIIKAWHDLIERAQINNGKQLIQDFDSLLTEQWPCSMVGMYVSKYLKEPRHALKVFELLSGSVKQISEKQVTEKQVSEKQVSEKEVSENENLDSEKQYQCSICDINFAYIAHCKFL